MMFLRGGALGDCTAAQFGPQTCIPDGPPGSSGVDPTDPSTFGPDCASPSADPSNPCFNQTFANLRAIDERAQQQPGQSMADDIANAEHKIVEDVTSFFPFATKPTSATTSVSAPSGMAWYTKAALLAAVTIGSVVAYRHYKGKRIAP